MSRLDASLIALKNVLRKLAKNFPKDNMRNGEIIEKNIPSIETIRKRFGSAVEARKKLGLDWFESGPQYKYNNENWQAPFMEFLREVLSSRNYARWAERNGGPSLKAIRDNVGSYSKALEKMLKIFIETQK